MKSTPRHPARLADTLSRVVQRIDPDKRLDAYRVWVFWADEVGDSIAARTRPLGFRRGVLSVRVSSHAWMQELQFMKETIRERLNARLGAELIREIYFVSAPESEFPAVEEEPAQASLEPVPAVPELSDPELTGVFRRIAEAHARRKARPRTPKR